MDEVQVDLGARSYPIRIGQGAMAGVADLLAARAPGARVAIVSDTNVAAHHLAALRSALASRVDVLGDIALSPGEGSKSFATLEDVCRALLGAKVERGDLILALGGGVIGDLAGFAASILRRGVRFAQLPTSLLAQVDSSVGG